MRKIEDISFRILHSERGMALILTLMILVIITAMVVEFSYGVYTSSASLYNWKDSQRLSLVAASGISLAVKTISDSKRIDFYRFPGKIEIPVIGILEGFKGSVFIRAEDENSKFNLNSIVWPKGTIKDGENDYAFDSFKALLRNLNLDETIADRVADWIDKDSEPSDSRVMDSEDSAKNTYMDTVDELLLIKGVDKRTYEMLLPYVTVYGHNSIIDSDHININTASIPVIMSLDGNERITKEDAERIAARRDITPFANKSDVQQLMGFNESLWHSVIRPRIVLEPSNLRITSIAEENRIKRIIESVIDVQDNKVRYWREM